MATAPVYADEPILGTLVLGSKQLFKESAADSLTATGTTQAGALPLTSELNRLATVGANSGVLLPPSAPGLTVFIVNHGANAVQVYGTGADTINDQTNTVGVSQMVNSTVLYTCHSIGAWYSEGLATGFAAGTGLGLQTVSYATVAANVAGTQVAGTPIVSMLNNVTSAATAYSVTLPPSAPGMEIVIHTITAGNTLKVFPNAGGTTTEVINALSANAAITMAALSSATFTCVVAGQWFTLPRVPT